MSKLLEIFGKAITVNTGDLIWHWLNALQTNSGKADPWQNNDFLQILDQLGNMELDKAEQNLRFYLFEKPECAYGRMAAAAVCLHRNSIPEAIEQGQSVYLRQPGNTMALYTLGYCHERIGAQAQALEFYQDCIKFKSHLQLPRQRMGAIYLRNGRVDNAIEQYELLVTEHPEDISSLVLLGYLYLADHQYERAIETFNLAIVSHPDNFHDDDEEQFGEFASADEIEDALEETQAIMEQVGEMPDMYVKMADILSRAGRITDAIVHYEHAIRLQPNYLEAAIKLGTHYLRLHRFVLAAEQFNRAVEINDEIVDAYIGLAVAQNKAEHSEDSLKTLSLACAIQQNSTLLFHETATLHLQITINEETGQVPPSDQNILLDDVIKAHQMQMASKPKSADVHYKFGILMMIKRNLNGAIESFENALRINPTHHRALSKLSLCLYEAHQQGSSIFRLTNVEPVRQETFDLHYQTALLYCDKHRFKDALVKLEETMKANYTEPDAIVNIQVVLENLGLVDRALATWDRLTEAAHKAISSKFQ